MIIFANAAIPAAKAPPRNVPDFTVALRLLTFWDAGHGQGSGKGTALFPVPRGHSLTSEASIVEAHHGHITSGSLENFGFKAAGLHPQRWAPRSLVCCRASSSASVAFQAESDLSMESPGLTPDTHHGLNIHQTSAVKCTWSPFLAANSFTASTTPGQIKV